MVQVYERVSDARKHLKDVLDAAQEGAPVRIERDDTAFAVVDATRLRHYLSALLPKGEMVAEDGGWSILFHGLPLAAEGNTIDEAFDDAVQVLRQYAEDWVERLHRAPSHVNNWGLVQLVQLSSDDELRRWLTGEYSERRALVAG